MTFNLADLFDRVANTVPEREALVSGNSRFTYHQLHQRVEALRMALVERGVHAGTRVGLALRNSPAYLEVMLAAFGLGAIPVNVNYRYQEAELEHILSDSGAAILFCENTEHPLMSQVAKTVATKPMVITNGQEYEALLTAPSLENAGHSDNMAASKGKHPQSNPTQHRHSALAHQRSDNDLYILYTGGTTGMPKGVMWYHKDIFYAAMGGNIRSGTPIVEPEDILANIGSNPIRTLFAAPFMHGTAQWMAFLTLLRGGTVLLSTQPSLDVAHLLDVVDAEAASYLVVVGDAIALPLSDLLQERGDEWDLSTLTTMLSGGAVLSVPVREAILKVLPWIVVVDSYGTTETGGQASMVYAAGMPGVSGQSQFELRPGSGLLNERNELIPASSREVGRVARSGYIPIGYFQDDEATQATFPIINGERWALTGDLAYMNEENQMVLLGRGSTTINSGGEKIYPGEIEAVLHAHPSVRDAVVVGVPDSRWGEQVAALVVIRTGYELAPTLLDEHCRASLADYKTPRVISEVAAIRRLESGKPDYQWALQCAMTAAQTNS